MHMHVLPHFWNACRVKLSHSAWCNMWLGLHVGLRGFMAVQNIVGITMGIIIVRHRASAATSAIRSLKHNVHVLSIGDQAIRI